MGKLTKDAVLQAMDDFTDPEAGRSIVKLQQVHDVSLEGGRVAIRLGLTTFTAPVWKDIQEELVQHLRRRLPQAAEVDVRVEPHHRPPEKIGQIGLAAKSTIAIGSGKGGVGKSTIAAILAYGLSRAGCKVGLLDADVYGFSIPRMLGVTGQPTIIDDKIVPLRKGNNLQVVSMGFFVHEDDPVIWRGPLLHKAINQFLTDVVWDDLDFLLLDLPPGTGDVTLTIAQSIPSAELLVVTTPQATATHVAGRVAKLAARTNLKVIGVIENMSYYETNGTREYIFGKDGGKELATRLGVEFFGEIPLSIGIREGGDSGKPAAIDGSPQQIALFEKLASAIEKKQ